MRARIRARFADLHHEREQIETQLAALAKTTPAAADPALLDQLPLAGQRLPEHRTRSRPLDRNIHLNIQQPEWRAPRAQRPCW